jgi:chromosome segregation ATPase
MNEAMIRNFTPLDIEKSYSEFGLDQLKWAVERLVDLANGHEDEVIRLDDCIRELSCELEDGCEECSEKDDTIDDLEKGIEKLEKELEECS